MNPGYFEGVFHSTAETIRDGGLHGWMAVLCLFTCKMLWAVLVKGLGMMLPTLQEQFTTSTWLIGWLVAIVEMGLQFSSILATPLKDKFGARTVVTVSGLVAGISLIIASFLSSIYAIAIILTLSTGPAIGISSVITKHLVGCYFSKSITTAYGIAGLGPSLSFLTIVPLLQLFLDSYGWRGTMLLLGGIFSHLAVCGALMKPPAAGKDGYEVAATDEKQEAVNDKVVPSNRFGCSCFTAVYLFTRDTFRLGLFSSISFWLIGFIVSFWTMVYAAWLIYYVQYTTVYKEFTLKDATDFIIAFGIGRIVACVVIGPVVQKVQVVSTYLWLGISLLMIAVCLALDPWLMSYWSIAANAFVLGTGVTMTAINQDVVVKEVFGQDQMGHALGWIGIVSGASNLLLYFPGLIYDTTGDYTVTFSLLAGIQLMTFAAVLWLHRRQKHHRSSSEASQ